MLKELARFTGRRIAEAQTVAADPGGVRCTGIREVQKAYVANRAPELEGTPAYSGTFFEQWQQNGLQAAWNGLVNRERELGVQFLPAWLKAVNTLWGSAALSTGLTQAKENRNSIILNALYELTVGILFYSEDSMTQTPIDSKDVIRRGVKTVKEAVADYTATDDFPGGQTPSGRQ